MGDGVLLLPQRGTWQVVEHRVRKALRYGQRDREQVGVEPDDNHGEHGDGAVPEGLASGRDRTA